MTGWAENTARCLADRKGATSLEYALILVAAAAVILAGFNTFMGTVSNVMVDITF